MTSKDIFQASSDTWLSVNNGLPSALYYYYYDDKLIDFNELSYNGVLGNCPSIQSIHYTPFLNQDDLNLTQIDYDVYRFGKLDSDRPTLTSTPPVFRIYGMQNYEKTLGSFPIYKVEGTTIGGKWNWRNESRLYNYPFMYGMLSDNLNQPLEVIYHLCKYTNATVKVRNTISDKCSYGIYIENYKGDTNGRLEAMVSSDGHELPCSSSAYSQWVATSKNQTSQNISNLAINASLSNNNLQQNSMLNLVGGIAGGVGSATTGNIGGVLSSLTGVASNYINTDFQQKMNNLSVQQAIQNNLAKESDLKTTPPTMISMGSNPYYGMVKGNKKLMFYRFGMREQYFERIGFYLHQFGYAQNKYISVTRNFKRSRYYFNYVKTTGANIVTGDGVPKSVVEQLKQIYDNGVTIWHMDREGVTMHNYDNDNYEV